MKKNNQSRDRSIAEWCHDFGYLYRKADKGRPPEEHWLAALAHCSSVGEAIRKQHYSDLMYCAAHTFCWICSYVSNLASRSLQLSDLLFYWPVGLSETIYLKFPGLCPYCLSNPCKCHAQKIDQQKNKGAHYVELLKHWKGGKVSGHTLRDWQTLFFSLYGSRIHVEELSSIGFHFLEEAGEEAQGVRKALQLRGAIGGRGSSVKEDYLLKLSSIEGLINEYANGDFPRLRKTGKPLIDPTSADPALIRARIVDSKMDIVIELADTFSWFCSILLKVEGLLKESELWSKKYDIEQYLESHYGHFGKPLKCPACKEQRCRCQSFRLR